MTESTRNLQQEWTLRVAELGRKANPELPLFQKSISDLHYLWFRNPLNKRSLRLSTAGQTAFTKFGGVKFHKIKLDTTVTGKQMLQLEELFSDPYYIGAGFILVSNEKDVIMLQLSDGNLAQELAGPSLIVTE